MKSKRLTALALALVLTLSMTVQSASAAVFTDLTGHWAKADVELLAGMGIVNGYSDGTFKPDAKMTAAEALLFCARATNLDAASKLKIAEMRREELKTILPASMISWASDELAICLETGIITHAELATLCQSGAISREVSRENLSFYLLRAMQLAPLAQGLTTYPLNFTDTSTISAGLQPYIYLLGMYGIVKGDETNKFNPRSPVTRATMATMLRRALDFMKAQGIVVELSEYTNYSWVAGTIAAVTGANKGVMLLTLNSDVSGTRSISLPADVKVYENNMTATSTALKVGQYARVNLNSMGTPTDVRLSGPLTRLSGTIASLTDSVLVLAGDTAKSVTIDRFTEALVGKISGDRSIIDEEAGYSTAVCQIDALGHLATVTLTGGTRTEIGFLSAVEKTGTSTLSLQISGFNGVNQRYTMAAGAGVTVNGASGTLSNSYTGKFITLSVSNDSGEIMAAALDTQAKYVQGAIKGTSYSGTTNTITIRDVTTGKATTYTLSNNAEITYGGKTVAVNKVDTSWFATLMLSGDQVVLVDCYPGSSTTEGVISDIHYGTPTVLSVKRADDTVVTFDLDLSALPTVYRSDKISSFDKLHTGDEVIVTVRYNKVESIAATPQSANMSGTISRITIEATGVTLDVKRSDGSDVSYQVGEGVSVVQDGKVISIFSLKPGFKISMVVDGTRVMSIDVDKSAASANQINGMVIMVNNQERTILVQVSDASTMTTMVTVYAGDVGIMDVDGSTVSLSRLTINDRVQIYGSYNGDSFKATLIIRT